MNKECCNIDEIKRLIPHRYPFLLIDRVINRTKSSMEKATDLQKCVLSKKLNDLTIIKNQL